MTKEQQELLDKAYENYQNYFLGYDDIPNKELFILACKTDTKFSERWGLKFEERELEFKERCDIQIKNLDGMYSSEKDIFIRSSIDAIKLMKMNENNIPTRLITITYNNETLESYE